MLSEGGIVPSFAVVGRSARIPVPMKGTDSVGTTMYIFRAPTKRAIALCQPRAP